MFQATHRNGKFDEAFEAVLGRAAKRASRAYRLPLFSPSWPEVSPEMVAAIVLRLIGEYEADASRRWAIARKDTEELRGTMSRADEHFAKFQVDGEITWPDDPAQRDRLASDLLGAEIIGGLNSARCIGR